MDGDGPTSTPLCAWIYRQADHRPDATALVFDGRAMSYADLAERVDRLAVGLAGRLGLNPGDRIAYLGKNHADLLTLVFAAARLGLIVLPLNWRLAIPELQAVLDDASPRALVIEAAFAAEAEALARQYDRMAWLPIALDFRADGWLHFEDLVQMAGEAPIVGAATDPVLLVYTSGTTGRAKGVVLTQDNIRWNAANSVDMHGLTAGDRILTTLPLFHVGGLNIQTLPALAVGAEVQLDARFDPSAMLRRIGQARPTHTILVPAMMKAIIDHPVFAETDLSSLRQITTGSSIVPAGLIRVFHDRGIPVTQVYGTTETAPIAVYQRLDEAFDTVGSTGRTARHGEMRVVDEDDRPVPAGIAGEIQIRGPQVAIGYWQNPSATAAAFDQGWFKTGDIGCLDQAGHLVVEARADDLIKSGSEKIYPAEIEDILREVDGVDEAIVVGRADPDWGEVPMAVVRPRPGAVLDPGRVLAALDGRIARFKWPKEVRIVDDLPRSALGKVLRYRLRADLERQDDGAAP